LYDIWVVLCSVAWTVILLGKVEEWFQDLVSKDPGTGDLVAAAIDLLEEEGPTLGRPVVDRVKGSRVHNMKELRPGSSGRSEIRILFVFDPSRQVVILAAGDKVGAWQEWYAANIPLAEARYAKWSHGGYDDERR